MAPHHSNEFYVALVASTILSFSNEYFGLVAHSLPQAGYLYKPDTLFKHFIDLVAIGGCATMATLHAPDQVVGKIYTSLTPIIAAFMIPTLIMESVLNVVDSPKLKMLIGATAILCLASVESLTSKLINDQPDQIWTIVPLLVFLGVSMFVFKRTHKTGHSHKDENPKPTRIEQLKHVLAIVLLFSIAGVRYFAWDVIPSDIRYILDIGLTCLLGSGLAFLALKGKVKSE